MGLWHHRHLVAVPLAILQPLRGLTWSPRRPSAVIHCQSSAHFKKSGPNSPMDEATSDVGTVFRPPLKLRSIFRSVCRVLRPAAPFCTVPTVLISAPTPDFGRMASLSALGQCLCYYVHAMAQTAVHRSVPEGRCCLCWAYFTSAVSRPSLRAPRRTDKLGSPPYRHLSTHAGQPSSCLYKTACTGRG